MKGFDIPLDNKEKKLIEHKQFDFALSEIQMKIMNTKRDTYQYILFTDKVESLLIQREKEANEMIAFAKRQLKDVKKTRQILSVLGVKQDD